MQFALGVVATATTEEKSVQVLMLRSSRYRIEGDVAVRHGQMGPQDRQDWEDIVTRCARLSYTYGSRRSDHAAVPRSWEYRDWEYHCPSLAGSFDDNSHQIS
ncbi:hypothetical protein J4Q44_G00078650 [Coregonus suidteri]|uniref:Uncharacterized protein n=1 Tax=Coregonus suidteri TaxID=861788 RepID=A0AAN8M319_9TELE